MSKVEMNENIPAITVSTTGDKQVELSDLKGKNIVLYFYPKDNTPGCTLEGRDFRDHYAEFEKLDTVVFGVSRDSMKSHEKFKAKQEFPFDLIADEDSQLCNMFNVVKEKSMFGNTFLGIIRSTFIIDKTGKLTHEWRKVKVSGHVQELLKTLRG